MFLLDDFLFVESCTEFLSVFAGDGVLFLDLLFDFVSSFSVFERVVGIFDPRVKDPVKTMLS